MAPLAGPVPTLEVTCTQVRQFPAAGRSLNSTPPWKDSPDSRGYPEPPIIIASSPLRSAEHLREKLQQRQLSGAVVGGAAVAAAIAASIDRAILDEEEEDDDDGPLQIHGQLAASPLRRALDGRLVGGLSAEKSLAELMEAVPAPALSRHSGGRNVLDSEDLCPWTPRVAEETSAPTTAGPLLPAASPTATSRSRRAPADTGSRARSSAREEPTGKTGGSSLVSDFPDHMSRRSGRPGSACPKPSPMLARRRFTEDEAPALGSWHMRLDTSAIGLDESFTSEGYLLSTMNDTGDWMKWMSPEKAVSAASDAVLRSRQAVPVQSAVIGVGGADTSDRSFSLGGVGVAGLSRPSSRGSTATCSRGASCTCTQGSNCRGAKSLPGVQRAGSKPRLQASKGPQNSGGPGFGRRANSMPARVPLPPALAAAGLPLPPEGEQRPHGVEVPPMICARLVTSDVASSKSHESSRPPTASAERKPGPSGQPLSWSLVGAPSAQPRGPGGYFGIVGSGGSGAPVELGEVLAEPKALIVAKTGQSGKRCRSAAAARTPIPVPVGKVGIAVSVTPVRGTRPMTGGSTKRPKADSG